MSDISEEELKKEIGKILVKADLTTTSAKTVRQKLEENLGLNLIPKKNLIKQLVIDYVDNMEKEEEKESSEEEEEEEEEVKKPKKRPAPAPKKLSKKKKKQSSDEDDNDSNDDDSADEKKKRTSKKKKGKKSDADSDNDWNKKKDKSKGKKGAGGGKGSGYTRNYKLSRALAEVMGAEEMPRHEVVKRMWAIIKERNLSDPNNRQFAICDEELYKVFGTKRFRTFGMMKYLKTHFLDD